MARCETSDVPLLDLRAEMSAQQAPRAYLAEQTPCVRPCRTTSGGGFGTGEGAVAAGGCAVTALEYTNHLASHATIDQ